MSALTKTLVVGIAGGSGSGKTTLVEQILRSPFAGFISFLPHDAYYHGAEHTPESARLGSECNWDHPEALDNALFLGHIDDLVAGKSVERPEYDFAHHRRRSRSIPVAARPVLLLEGILLLAIPEISQRIHLRLFIETPADLRFMRRMMRDINERGRTVESVVRQYEATVRPMHERYVEPSRNDAHLIVPWLRRNETAVALLLARIAGHLSG